jgi:hypothetical protein
MPCLVVWKNSYIVVDFSGVKQDHDGGLVAANISPEAIALPFIVARR